MWQPATMKYTTIISRKSMTNTYIHTYIQTIAEMQWRIICLVLSRSAITSAMLSILCEREQPHWLWWQIKSPFHYTTQSCKKMERKNNTCSYMYMLRTYGKLMSKHTYAQHHLTLFSWPYEGGTIAVESWLVAKYKQACVTALEFCNLWTCKELALRLTVVHACT